MNDFRKIVGIESYADRQCVGLTARTNDEGWATVLEWLKTSKLAARTAFVLSVGGGNLEKNISPNLVTALQFTKTVGARLPVWWVEMVATPPRSRTPA